MSDGADAMLGRLRRDSLWVGVAFALVAGALWPTRLERPLGVLGGLVLAAVSYRGIVAGIDGLWGVARPSAGASAPSAQSRPGFVKFFTRHGMLAVGAYVMMARFGLDPVAMLVGVSAPLAAAVAEAVRTVRARKSGPHTGSS